jgi:hypothetical protein
VQGALRNGEVRVADRRVALGYCDGSVGANRFGQQACFVGLGGIQVRWTLRRCRRARDSEDHCSSSGRLEPVDARRLATSQHVQRELHLYRLVYTHRFPVEERDAEHGWAVPVASAAG